MEYSLEDLQENDIFPIGIRTSMEPHQLAYQLNQKMDAIFRRKQKDIQIAEKAVFSHFEWEDTTRDIRCHILANHCWVEDNTVKNSLNLFELSPSKKVSLIPEFEMIDFFIVQEDWDQTSRFLTAFQNIAAIEMSQVIENSKHRELFNFVWTY